MNVVHRWSRGWTAQCVFKVWLLTCKAAAPGSRSHGPGPIVQGIAEKNKAEGSPLSEELAVCVAPGLI